MKDKLIPSQFLFRFALRCQYRKPVVQPESLPETHRLAYFGDLDGQGRFADVRAAWNEGSFTIEWSLPTKRQAIYGEMDRPEACDGLTLWIDTRDARTAHRATRHCHQFFFLAHGGAAAGRPLVLQRPIHRAAENPPTADLAQIVVERQRIDSKGEPAKAKEGDVVKGYWMQVVLPAATLHGFEPDVNNRLGFCYHVRDRELGEQISAPGEEFPYTEDPSLWNVLELHK